MPQRLDRSMMQQPISDGTPPLLSVPLSDELRDRRDELRSLRESLFALHTTSIATLEDHESKERELLNLLVSLKPKRNGGVSMALDRLFSDFFQVQKQSTEERPRSLTMEGEMALHVQNAQKEASDRRFEYDNTNHQAMLLRRAVAEWEKILEDLNARFAEVQLQFIQLSHDEKTLVDDNHRIKQELGGWLAHRERLRKVWTDVKERYDLLAGERERREGVLRHRLEAAVARREAREAAVREIREEQQRRREVIGRLEVDVEDWVERRERADMELARLVEQARHRQAQLRLFAGKR
jgi:chromosome segregation ATPase